MAIYSILGMLFSRNPTEKTSNGKRCNDNLIEGDTQVRFLIESKQEQEKYDKKYP